jgi:hypothetical protein
VALLLVPLIVILVAFVAYAQAALARSVSGGFIGWIGGAIKSSLFVAGSLIPGAVELTRWMTRAIGSHFAQVESRAVGWIVGMEQAIRYAGAYPFAQAIELFHFANWVVSTAIPDAVRALPNSTTTIVHSLTKIVHVTETKVVHVYKYIRVAAHSAAAVAVPHVTIPYLREWNWIHRHWKALTGAIAIPWLPKIGYTISGLRKRIRRLEALLAAGVGVGLIVSTIDRVVGSWWRCKNVSKVGKAICRSNTKWLENLLLGAVAIFGTLSLITFATEVYALMNATVKEVAHFWRADVSRVPQNPGLGDTGGGTGMLAGTGAGSGNPGLGQIA